MSLEVSQARSDRDSFGLLLVGFVFVLCTLPQGVVTLSEQKEYDWLALPARWSVGLSNVLPSFAGLLPYIGYLLLLYVLTLVIMSVRYRRPDLAGVGLLALVLSTVVTVALATLLLYLIVWGGYLLRIVRDFLEWLPLLSTLSDVLTWVMIVTLWVGIAIFLFGLRPGLVKDLVESRATIPVSRLRFFWLVVGSFLVPIVWAAVLTMIMLDIDFLGLLVALFVLGIIGRLFVCQIRDSMLAGSGRLGVIMGAIAIGSTMAILLLVGNVYRVYDLLPSGFSEFAAQHIYQESPSFDALVVLLIVGLCVVSLLRNLVRMRSAATPDQFRESLIYSLFSPVVALALAAVAGDTERRR